MQPSAPSAGMLARRKFYLALPLLCLPFLTFLYWILFAKQLKASAPSQQSPEGLLTSLPDPALKDKPMNKLMYYQQAEQDSLARAQQIKKDPYRQAAAFSALDTGLGGIQKLDTGELTANQARKATRLPAREQENHLRSKLRQLDAVLTRAQAPEFTSAASVSPAESPTGALDNASELARFESMMTDLEDQLPEQSQDPELDELNGMLDKILDIQRLDNAGLVATTPAGGNNQPAPTQVRRQEQQTVSYFGGAFPDPSFDSATDQRQPTGDFFSLDLPGEPADSGITAVVDHGQQLVSGSVVTLRLTAPIRAGGMVVPRNTLVYGQAALNGERLMIQINSIRLHNSLLTVALTAYDLDGLEGLYIPGALPRNVAKQSLGQDLQGYQTDLPGFSLGAQAANAGIQVGKTILSRKARLTQVTLTEGYQLILMDKNLRFNPSSTSHDLSTINP